jgi:hypothetical protein
VSGRTRRIASSASAGTDRSSLRLQAAASSTRVVLVDRALDCHVTYRGRDEGHAEPGRYETDERRGLGNLLRGDGFDAMGCSFRAPTRFSPSGGGAAAATREVRRACSRLAMSLTVASVRERSTRANSQSS